MKSFLTGKKIGMTHIYNEEGKRCPVTVIETELFKEEQKQEPEQKQELEKEQKPVKEQEQEQEQKEEKEEEKEQGQERVQEPEKEQETEEKVLKAETGQLKAGDFVDITGISKGKGFQGGMKRWNWSGTPKTHGSMSHRRAGSIGASATPSRVLKGKHMPGHMGNKKVTVQNLQVIKLDKENNLLVVKGAVPGHRNSKLIIKKAKKKS
jgi:large subunit ribosomal protein L3